MIRDHSLETRHDRITVRVKYTAAECDGFGGTVRATGRPACWKSIKCRGINANAPIAACNAPVLVFGLKIPGGIGLLAPGQNWMDAVFKRC